MRGQDLADNGTVANLGGEGSIAELETVPECTIVGEQAKLRVAVLTGGFDRHYAFGLVMALAARGVRIEVIGSDVVDSEEMHTTPGVWFLNFQSNWKPNVSRLRKALRLSVLYLRLCRYAVKGSPGVFHILWNTKVPFIDRVLLMLLYKARSKKVALTAHNVNTAKRDSKDSWWNRLTLGIQYRLTDHIFVHTTKMRDELITDFHVQPSAISLIPFGINNATPCTSITPEAARAKLGIRPSERVILFFGRIQPYKGLDYLSDAFTRLTVEGHGEYRLVIAGEPQKESREHWLQVSEQLRRSGVEEGVLAHIRFIPDDETEIFFKAADVVALPYRGIYQSGVLFLAYRFGVPVIATDVGSFREEIVEGKTGYLCQPDDVEDLTRVIKTYFESDLYRTLGYRRAEIRELAHKQHSWDEVARITCEAYRKVTKDEEWVKSL